MTDEDTIAALVDSNSTTEKLMDGLPIKWVVKVCNACIRGSDYTGSLKRDCVRDLARWHVTGEINQSVHMINKTRKLRWTFILEETVKSQRGYAQWLYRKADRYTQRADRIQKAHGLQ
jgi:hypothetical protein